MIRALVILVLAAGGLAAAPVTDKKEPLKEPANEKKADPAKEPEKIDPKQTAERIVQDAQAAGKRLADKDPGAETRQHQSDVLKGLDALIRLAQNPPPSDQNQSGNPPPMSSPMGGGGNAKQQS